MAKARIGHFVEAQILEALGVDYVDECEVLTPADEAHHIDKWGFTVPFVCGATNLGEALRRISEGAAMIRSKGEAGTGNVVEAVRHLRSITGDIRRDHDSAAEQFDGPRSSAPPSGSCRRWPRRAACRSAVLRRRPRHPGRRRARHAARAPRPCSWAPASSRATTPPAGPRRSSRPPRTTPIRDILAKVSRGLGAAMTGLEIDGLETKLAERGW